MTATLTQSFRIDGPLDLGRTVGGGYGAKDPTTRRTPDGLWRATWTPEGAATLCLRPTEGGVEASAWGPGAEAALATVPDLVGAWDDPGAAPRSGVVGELASRFAGLRLTRGRPLLELLVPMVLGQRVTGHEAKASYREMVRALGEPAPGPLDLRMPPTARALRALPAWELRRFGVDSQRARAIRNVCDVAHRLEPLRELPPAELCAKLQVIRGIGPWTATLTVANGQGWTDAVPLGDYNLPNMVAWLLAGEPRGDDDRMLELLEPYAGQRWRVIRLLKASGVKAPRYGPRLPAWNDMVDIATRRRRGQR